MRRAHAAVLLAVATGVTGAQVAVARRALARPLPHAATGEPLPLGDGRVSAAPRRGHVYACGRAFPGGGGAQRVGEWIRDGRWYPDEKPVVEGEVAWPNAELTLARETTPRGDRRVVRANNLPTHPTGEFPVRPGTRAYRYDRNPNAIRAQRVLLDLPADPDTSGAPGCVPMGMIGFSLSGAALFNAFDLAGRDAPAYEVQDRCDGHPEVAGRYHYHAWSPCLPDPDGDAGRHSSLTGYMLDGVPIYGPRGDGGRPVTNADLDPCHGHAHPVALDGAVEARYHYHFTREFPYAIGCYRAARAAPPR